MIAWISHCVLSKQVNAFLLVIFREVTRVKIKRGLHILIISLHCGVVVLIWISFKLRASKRYDHFAFTIDNDGIIKHKNKTMLIPWADIVNVYEDKQRLHIKSADGATCLSKQIV